uniref:Spore protein YkvP/CgeB glycosyl transferase-like domain-containing protein n=1 Tax=Magnetococcus massalia (strain MO-1) TaxID=451514 RepID=A0A1S7LDN8_MAGMO|nr:conserved protein of unknown function [Candidatus Magnetococcus massalia]
MQAQLRILVLASLKSQPKLGSMLQALAQQAEIVAAGPGNGDLDLPFATMGCGDTSAVESILDALPENFTPDAVLCLETGNFYPQGLIGCETPCFYYAMDPQLNIHWQTEYSKLFDAVFTPSPSYEEPLRRYGHPAVYWQPLGIEPALFNNQGLERDLDVAFVGEFHADSHPQRHQLRRMMMEQGLNVLFEKPHSDEQIAALYNRARVVLHQGEKSDYSVRPLQAAACGAVPCSSDMEGLATFLQPDQACLTYSDPHTLMHQLENLLANSDRWQQLSSKAQKSAVQGHWPQVIDQLLQRIQPFIGQKRFHFPEQERMKAHAFVYHTRGFGGRGIRMLNAMQEHYPHDVELPLLKALTYLNSNLYLEAAKELDSLLTLKDKKLPSAFIEQISDVLVNTFELAGYIEGAIHAAEAIPQPSPAQRSRLLRLIGRSENQVPYSVIKKLAPHRSVPEQRAY